MSYPVALRMQLKPGCAAEYERRHDAIWPELVGLLNEAGVYDYSIFLDGDDLSLFAVMRLGPDYSEALLSAHPVMRRWWTYMADLMIADDDNRPVQWPMRQVFRLPETAASDLDRKQ